MFDFLGAISPARAKSSDGIVNDSLPEARCTDCGHCFSQDTIGCFAGHLSLWELLRAQVALLLVNVIVHDTRIGNVVIIWREPPPDRSRDGSQVSQESRWYLDDSTEERASILQRRSELKIGSVGVSSLGDGLLAA